MIDLWRAWKGSGLAPGHLPFAGGFADQPAAVWECFQVMSAAEKLLPPAGG